jgi:peptidoglycan/xylan/chitin deacetylase (PgdA/CDA1 family)
MLRSLKLGFLRIASGLGVTSRILESRWRQQRLLILCYHGVSLGDEHEWNTGLYMPPALFRRRMETLRRLGCAVLPLGDALRRLHSGALPKKSIVITFDDGNYDFYRMAYPVLSEYGFPSTVYLTTYYTGYNRAVFDVMLSYLLWRGRTQLVSLPVPGLRAQILLDETGRVFARREIAEYARLARLTARDKGQLLVSIAAALGVDYEDLCTRRVLHLMNLDEVGELSSRGVEFQLHTHRHRVSRDRAVFLEEIRENRACLSRVCDTPAVHFCYPSGRYFPELLEFLREAGIESAATCDSGLAHPRSDPLLLPRLLDVSGMSATEYTAWISGLASLLPRRSASVAPPEEARRRPAKIKLST